MEKSHAFKEVLSSSWGNAISQLRTPPLLSVHKDNLRRKLAMSDTVVYIDEEGRNGKRRTVLCSLEELISGWCWIKMANLRGNECMTSLADTQLVDGGTTRLAKGNFFPCRWR